MELVEVVPTGEIARYAGYGLTDIARTTIPTDGEPGYAHGCLCRKVNGTTALDALYVNIGTVSSCNFDPVYSSDRTGIGVLQLTAEGWKVWDAMQTNLPGTAANDDLGLSTGLFLDADPLANLGTIRSVDYGGTDTTAYARRSVVLPPDYKAGTNITLQVSALMQVVSDTSASLDFEVADNGDDGVTDICQTAAQSINSAVYATKSFTLSGANAEAGHTLDIRMKFAGSDVGNAQNNINAIIYPPFLVYTRHLFAAA